MNFLRKIALILLPICIVGAGALAAWTMIVNRPEVQTETPQTPLPVVRTATVKAQPIQFRVRSQGTVRPKRESSILNEVAGRVVWVSPSLAGGAFFEEGELLVKLDTADYELSLLQARTAIAEAEVRLEREREEAAVAKREWATLGKGNPSPLALREPQMREAQALLESRQAAVKRAELDLERTKIYAPYRGRVRQKLVDLGQFLNRGSVIANIYGVDIAEVLLPIPDEDAAFLQLPMSYAGEPSSAQGVPVRFFATFAGTEHSWQGRIVRTEGEIDSKTRMIQVIAEVNDPYERGPKNRPPLAAGMFVEAEIVGRSIHSAVALPRSALRAGDLVYVVDSEQRVDLRSVEVLRGETDRVILRKGLDDGEQVVISILDAPTQGMRVRVAGSQQPGQGGAE